MRLVRAVLIGIVAITVSGCKSEEENVANGLRKLQNNEGTNDAERKAIKKALADKGVDISDKEIMTYGLLSKRMQSKNPMDPGQIKEYTLIDEKMKQIKKAD